MTRFSLFALSLLLVAACSENGSGPEINFSDAASPPPPDAEVCTQTECGNECVDISTNSLHCGGCNMACASAGQICSGSLPCACADPFVPADIGGATDQVFARSGAIIGLSPLGFSPLNIVVVIYDLTLETGVDYNFADSLANVAPPTVAAGYDVDTSAFTAHTAYAATEGTINFDTLCDGGASGTISNVVLSEIAGIMDPTPVVGGCSQEYTTLNFDIGTCPPGGGNGGDGTP